MNELFYETLKRRLDIEYPIGIPRSKIDVATGHVLNKRTLSNWDNSGKGIKGRFTLKNKVIYPVDAVIKFLRNNITEIS